MAFNLLLTSPYNLRANSLQTGSDCVVCVRSKWARMINECVVGGALMSGGWRMGKWKCRGRGGTGLLARR